MLRRVTRIAFISLVVHAVCGGVAYAQMPDYSIYDDGTVGLTSGVFEFYGWSSVEDNPPAGCDHYDYYTTTTVTSPTNRTSWLESGGTSSNVMLEVDDDYGYWNIDTSGYLTCSCAGGTLTYSGNEGFSFDVRLSETYFKECIPWGFRTRYWQYNCSSGTPVCGVVPFVSTAETCYTDVHAGFVKYRKGTGSWSCSPGIILGHNTGPGACF
jgi:hypothetical protein